MTEENKRKNVRVMILNGIVIDLPDHTETAINKDTGYGEVILRYMASPEQCYETHKEITTKWKEHSSSCFKFS